MAASSFPGRCVWALILPLAAAPSDLVLHVRRAPHPRALIHVKRRSAVSSFPPWRTSLDPTIVLARTYRVGALPLALGPWDTRADVAAVVDRGGRHKRARDPGGCRGSTAL